MNLSLAGWSPAGIAAAGLIVAGIALLVVYALPRGLHHRELEGMDPDPEPGGARPTAAAVRRGQQGPRTVGAAGAALLVAGLALGLVSAAGGWDTSQTTAGPGTAPDDCAGSWEGCPQATVAP